ncbi:MAG: fasciclin domain-containing protein [Hyphomicrobiales bacterium]
MKKFCFLFIVILMITSCKKESSKSTPSTKTDYEKLIDGLEYKGVYNLFLRGMDMISAETKLVEEGYTLLIPDDDQLQRMFESKGYSNINEIPHNELKKMLLNHFIFKKYTIDELKKIEEEGYHAKTMAQKRTSSGATHNLTAILDRNDNDITVNDAVVGDEVYNNNQFRAYSVNKAVAGSVLGNLIKKYDFYSNFLKGKSDFDILYSVNKSESSTIIGLTNDGLRSFIDTVGTKNIDNKFITRFARNIYMPNVTINIDDVFQDTAFKQYENLLGYYNKISSLYMYDQVNVMRRFSVKFTDSFFPYEFFTVYYTPTAADGYYSIGNEFHVTENGSLILYLGSKKREK